MDFRRLWDGVWRGTEGVISSFAGLTNTQNEAIQNAVAAYDQTVAGLQSTLMRDYMRKMKRENGTSLILATWDNSR